MSKNASFSFPKKYARWILIASVVALLISIGLALLESATGFSFARQAAFIQALTTVWTSLFLIATIPLVVVFVMNAIVRLGMSKALTRFGWISAAFHFSFMIIGFWSVVALNSVAMPPLFADSLSGMSLSDIARAENIESGSSMLNTQLFGEIRSVVGKIILPVLIVTILLSITMIQFFKSSLDRLHAVLNKLSSLLLKLILALLAFVPVALLGAVYSIYMQSGLGMITSVIGFIIYQVAVISLLIVAFFVFSYFLGNASLKRLFNAMIPTFVLAVSTRSSYACLASTTDSAVNGLDIEEDLIHTAIPFYLITFRANRCLVSVLTLQYFAYALGLGLSFNFLMSYMLLGLIASIGSPGLPGSTRFTSLPYYIALGAPAELYIFLKSVDDLPDIFKTIMNVTYPVVLLSVVNRFSNRFRVQQAAR